MTCSKSNCRQQPEDVKSRSSRSFKLVIHDLIKMKIKSKNYSDVEEYILKIRTGPLRTIFDEDLGKEMLIEYAHEPDDSGRDRRRNTKRPSRNCAPRSRKERPGSTWANDFSRAMAEILLDARNKELYAAFVRGRMVRRRARHAFDGPLYLHAGI